MGHRFNPNKLLLDPYAYAHIGTLQWNPALFGYQIESEDDLTFDDRDSAPFMPKCTVVDPNFDWAGERGRKQFHFDDTILYEMHLRGFTKLHPAVPGDLQGTYAGLAANEVVDYIKSLGVTSVELLPIQTFVDDSQLLEKGLTNYWGYNTLGFFAPDPRYAAAKPDSLREFKEMVARLHGLAPTDLLRVRIPIGEAGSYRLFALRVAWGTRIRRLQRCASVEHFGEACVTSLVATHISVAEQFCDRL